MLSSDKKRMLFFRLAVIIPLVLLVLLLAGQIVYITYFNKQVYSTAGKDETSPTFIDMEPRDDSTSFWLKRGFEWKGKTIDLKAQTIDGVLHNNAADTISSWTMRVDITDDCFINNAWCGTMEIHQHVAEGKEKVQTLDLRKYEIEDVTLDHTYDGDLLIPLQKGDYLLYYPSEVDDEVPISGNSELTMGVIFYYFDELGFYDYAIDYSYHRTVTQGAVFYIILVIGVLWLIALAVYIASRLIYKDAEKQMELKKSALSTMSDIYQSIYIIDLENDTLTPVIEKTSGEFERPDNLTASAQIRNLFEADAEDAYRDFMIELCDLKTLPERMKDRQSIAGEYISKVSGWCSIRFFAMDRIEGRDLDRVLFTVQIIDAEKREIDAITDKITHVEREMKANAAFLDSISGEMLSPVQAILKAEEDLKTSSSEEEKERALQDLRHETKTLETVLSDIRDYSRIESGRIKPEQAVFSLKEFFAEVQRFGEELLEGTGTALDTDLGPALPARIEGDKAILHRVLCNLISAAHEHTEEGSICLSVFGREAGEDRAHLVFSVRDTGNGEGKEGVREIGLVLAEGLLLELGSDLEIIHTPGIGTEAFFEMEVKAEF